MASQGAGEATVYQVEVYLLPEANRLYIMRKIIANHFPHAGKVWV